MIKSLRSIVNILIVVKGVDAMGKDTSLLIIVKSQQYVLLGSTTFNVESIFTCFKQFTDITVRIGPTQSNLGTV
jgi:hypothetical protein